jgi:peptidoglycan/LPS O-acetylase OafA/YrhL
MSFSTKALKWITGLIIPVISILSVVIVGLIYEPKVASNLVVLGTTTRCLAISLGAFLAFHAGWLSHFSKRAFTKILFIGLGFYLLYYFMPLIPGLKLVPQYARLVCIVPLLSVMAVMIWYGINNIREGFSKSALLNPVVEYVGKISYGLYLFHYPIYYYFNFTDWQTPKSYDVFTYWLVIALSIIAAILSFHFIETPILNLRHKVNFNKKAKLVSQNLTYNYPARKPDELIER